MTILTSSFHPFSRPFRQISHERNVRVDALHRELGPRMGKARHRPNNAPAAASNPPEVNQRPQDQAQDEQEPVRPARRAAKKTRRVAVDSGGDLYWVSYWSLQSIIIFFKIFQHLVGALAVFLLAVLYRIYQVSK